MEMVESVAMGSIPAPVPEYCPSLQGRILKESLLSEAQLDEIRKQLKDRAGRSIKITAKVDPSILGGLIVRMGSQMIDSSIKTRLNTLSQAMKG